MFVVILSKVSIRVEVFTDLVNVYSEVRIQDQVHILVLQSAVVPGV